MANLFRDNAYNVLGLDTSATQKEINKRSKEIVNLLRIDEDFEHVTEISVARPKRTENTVKEALHRLSSPTKKIQEYFFWFDIESDKDEKAWELLRAGSIDEAIQVWELDSSKETAIGFVAKKNLAILASVLLDDKGHKKYLKRSITYWKDLITSDKFWSYFEKMYALNDEVGTSKAALKEFNKNVVHELADFYTDVSQTYNDSSIYAEYLRVFSVKGSRIEQNILSPIYESIDTVSKQIIELNVSEDGILDEEEIKIIKTYTHRLNEDFNELKNLGLYEDSQSKVMRDKAATAVRVLVLDINNNLDDSKTAIGLLGVALKFAGTPNLQNKLKQDMSALKELHEDKLLNEEINATIEESVELHKKGKSDMAIAVIDEKMADAGLSSSAKSVLQNFKDKIETAVSTHGKPVKRAPLLFTWNSIGTKLYGDTLYLVVLFIPLLPLARYSVEETDSGQFMFYGKLPLTNGKRWWVGLALLFVLIFIIAAASSSDTDTSSSPTSTVSPIKSSGSSQSAYNRCSNEYDSIKSELDSVESSMNRYDAIDDVNNFNALVPRQNALVNQLNSKATECNGLR